MRYAQSETTNILGVFNSGDSVTIDIYRLSDNSKVVDAAPCTEIGTTGVFKYEFSQAVSQKEEFLWIMSNGEYSKYGKVILGGYMDDIKATITDHRDVVEPKIDTTISSRASQESVNTIPTNPLLDDDPRLDNLDVAVSSRLASNDSRLDNLDVPVSSRSSHSPTDIWNYSNRTLTSSVSLTDSDKDDIANKVWDEPISEHAIDGTFGQKNQKAVPSEDINDYKADISGLAKQDTVQAIRDQTDKLTFDSNNNVIATLNDDLQTTLSLILGLVQHNYKLYNTEYVTIKGVKRLSSALIRIYPTKEDLQNDTNPLKAYSLSVEYDEDGNIKSYTCTESD